MRKVTDLKREEGILCNTLEELNSVCKLLDKEGLTLLQGGKWKGNVSEPNGSDSTVVYPADGQYATGDWAKREGHKLYHAIDFLKDKGEVVGYNLVKEEYRETVFYMVGIESFNQDHCHFYVGSYTAITLMKAGVLDLWCEPVYEEKPLKKGDIAVSLRKTLNYKEGEIGIINYISSGKATFVGKPEGGGNTRPIDWYRHATLEEIEDFNATRLPALGGYKGKFEGEYISWGCQKYEKGFVNKVANIFSSATLNGGVSINEEQMEQIRAVTNLNLEK